MQSRVKEWRELRGYSQAQLASFIGVTTNTIQNLEKDPEPLMKTLRLAAILNCRPEDLVSDSEPEENSKYSIRKPTPKQLAAIRELLSPECSNKSDQKE